MARNLWREALKEWNAKKKNQTYMIPKKGSKEHMEIKKIQEKLKNKK